MLELARLLCKQHGKYAVWIAFFDGEEAVRPQWRIRTIAMAAARWRRALPTARHQEDPRVLLADIVGGRNSRVPPR